MLVSPMMIQTCSVLLVLQPKLEAGRGLLLDDRCCTKGILLIDLQLLSVAIWRRAILTLRHRLIEKTGLGRCRIVHVRAILQVRLVAVGLARRLKLDHLAADRLRHCFWCIKETMTVLLHLLLLRVIYRDVIAT